jgi:hypothetical protein
MGKIYIYIIYASTLKLLYLEFIDRITGNKFPVMQSIHNKQSNFLVDDDNNIAIPTTHLLQGVPTYRTIDSYVKNSYFITPFA